MTSRILGRIALAATLALIGLSAVWTPANAANTEWKIRPHSVDKCVEIPHSTLSVVQVDIYKCLSTLPENEKWVFISEGTTSDGLNKYRLKNVATGKCMNLPGSSPAVSGDGVFQNTCQTKDYQESDQWEAFRVSTGTNGNPDYYQLRSYKNDSLCLNVKGNSTANDAPLIVYGCTDAPNSEFTWSVA